jgi:NAD+ diphosphatase
MYSSADVDRQSLRRGDSGFIDELMAESSTKFIPVDSERNLIRRGEQVEPVFLNGMMARVLVQGGALPIFLGTMDEVSYFALDVTGFDLGERNMGEFLDLRQVGALLFAREGSLLAYARGMTYWHRRHRFCGACGNPTTSGKAGHERVCVNEDCATTHFPRTDPAVIMLVTHGDYCLLGRGAHFPRGMHSTLAGFVEPGESFEDAVAREVLEEVRVRVSDVIYQSSQPWPFPASVMIGFRATADSMEFEVNRDELESAQWYHRSDLQPERLPQDGSFFLPRKDSIARRLIEDWLAGSSEEAGASRTAATAE